MLNPDTSPQSSAQSFSQGIAGENHNRPPASSARGRTRTSRSVSKVSAPLLARRLSASEATAAHLVRVVEAQSRQIKQLSQSLAQASKPSNDSQVQNRTLQAFASTTVALLSELTRQRTQTPDNPAHMIIPVAGKPESVTVWPAGRSDDGRVMDRLTTRTRELFGEGCTPEILPDKVTELQEQLRQLQEAAPSSKPEKEPETPAHRRKRTKPTQVKLENQLYQCHQQLEDLKEINRELTQTVKEQKSSLRLWSDDASKSAKEAADLSKRVQELECQLAHRQEKAELVIEGHHLVEILRDDDQAEDSDEDTIDTSAPYPRRLRSDTVTIDPDQMTTLTQSAPESSIIKLANNVSRSGRQSLQPSMYGMKAQVGRIETKKKRKKEPREQSKELAEELAASPVKVSGKDKASEAPPPKRKKPVDSKTIKLKTPKLIITKCESRRPTPLLNEPSSSERRKR